MEVTYRASDYSQAEKSLFFHLLQRDDTTGCLIWTGSTMPTGYGQFRVNGKKAYVHRLAWKFAGNKIPKNKPHVLHGCPSGPNKLCCEISHLRVGTDLDNSIDSMKAGAAGRKRSVYTDLPLGVKEKPNGRFEARLRISSRDRSFGHYDTANEAHLVASFVRKIRMGILFIGDSSTLTGGV